MSAMKVKGLQIKKLQAPENSRRQTGVTDTVVKPEEVSSTSGLKGLFDLIGQFVVVGGDLA